MTDQKLWVVVAVADYCYVIFIMVRSSHVGSWILWSNRITIIVVGTIEKCFVNIDITDDTNDNNNSDDSTNTSTWANINSNEQQLWQTTTLTNKNSDKHRHQEASTLTNIDSDKQQTLTTDTKKKQWQEAMTSNKNKNNSKQSIVSGRPPLSVTVVFLRCYEYKTRYQVVVEQK
jgi:hypothetical protein